MLSNQEVVDIVASAATRSGAARAVVESAVKAWKHKYPNSKVDDCAVVCLFLNKVDDCEESSEKEEIDGGEDETETDWSALEGVSRANTLLNLPRVV